MKWNKYCRLIRRHPRLMQGFRRPIGSPNLQRRLQAEVRDTISYIAIRPFEALDLDSRNSKYVNKDGSIQIEVSYEIQYGHGPDSSFTFDWVSPAPLHGWDVSTVRKALAMRASVYRNDSRLKPLQLESITRTVIETVRKPCGACVRKSSYSIFLPPRENTEA